MGGLPFSLAALETLQTVAFGKSAVMQAANHPPNKSLKRTAQTGAASHYCAGSVRFALCAPLFRLALRYAPSEKCFL